MLLDSAQVPGSPQQFDRAGVPQGVRVEAHDLGALTKRVRPIAAEKGILVE
jgi:hypothetical protein